MTRERTILTRLGILHFLLGCVSTFFFSFFLPYVWFNMPVLLGMKDPDMPVPAFFVAWMSIILPSFFLICGWMLGGMILLAGLRMWQQRDRVFCTIVAGMECILAPLGTVLGFYTLRFLSRDAVRELFLFHALEEEAEPGMVSDPPAP